jgi:hypothetical protein
MTVRDNLQSVILISLDPDPPLTIYAFADLLKWLQNFTDPDRNPTSTCRLAYEERKSQFMRQLEELGVETQYKSTEDSIQNTYSSLRHCIGRLAHHFRCAKSLVQNASRLHDLLDDYIVKPITTPSRTTSFLQIRGKTNLDSIVKRMLPNQSPQLDTYWQALEEMDRRFQLSEGMLKNYEDPNVRPRVHAEIQILEHFYCNNLEFADSDRYIACSKAACFCCWLYIRHHPGNLVEPSCHCNIYLNWRPPDAEEGPKQTVQRDILNKMTADIRIEVLDQILQRSGPHKRHPDSETGITLSSEHGRVRNVLPIDPKDSQCDEDLGEFAMRF